jgi:hypothetical protein
MISPDFLTKNSSDQEFFVFWDMFKPLLLTTIAAISFLMSSQNGIAQQDADGLGVGCGHGNAV